MYFATTNSTPITRMALMTIHPGEDPTARPNPSQNPSLGCIATTTENDGEGDEREK